METPIAPDSGDEEHAVIAYFRLAGDGFGDVDQRERIWWRSVAWRLLYFSAVPRRLTRDRGCASVSEPQGRSV